MTLYKLALGEHTLWITFHAPPADGLERRRLADAPAVLLVRDDHPLAERESVALAELADETFVVGGGPGSPGFTTVVTSLCRDAGFEPRVVADPYPDLGLTAVRNGLGVVLYVRGAFGPEVPGSAFVPVRPEVTLPFDLLWRSGRRSASLDAVLAAADMA